MKKNAKAIQGLFLLLLCTTFLLSYSSTTEELQILNEKAIAVNQVALVDVHTEGCPECDAAFKECNAAPEKQFTDEVERISDAFKAGKIKREEKDKAFEVAKAAYLKASSVCSATFEKCCLQEMQKATEATKAKSK